MTAAATTPEIRKDGDPWIAGELERVRLQRRLLGGELPAFRRGLIYFDFEANKARIGPAPGGAA